MTALVVLGLIGAACFMGVVCGRQYQAEIEYHQEQQDEAAYRWAVENDRLPTVHHYIDSETGEELDSRW